MKKLSGKKTTIIEESGRNTLNCTEGYSNNWITSIPKNSPTYIIYIMMLGWGMMVVPVLSVVMIVWVTLSTNVLAEERSFITKSIATTIKERKNFRRWQ